MRASVLLHILSFALLAALLSAEVSQVQVLHRHGARPHLSKIADDPSVEKGGAILLAQGVAQLRALGEATRARYLTAGKDTTITGSSVSYGGSSDVYAVSTELARTLSSSRAFLSGLYPDEDDGVRVPTFVFAVEERDWLLRGYNMCPKLSDEIERFLDGEEYKEQAKKVEAAGALSRVARQIGEETDLSNAFNTYDRYLLTRSKYVDDELPVISADDFAAIKDAADWMESRKFGNPAVAGTLAGGGVVSQFLDYSEAMSAKNGSNVDKHRVVEYSGHYPLILGALAALGLDSSKFKSVESKAASRISEVVPDFGAALLWELHSDDKVRLLWRDGGDNADFVPIPCDEAGSELACRLSDMKSRLEKGGTLFSGRAFCDACGKEDDLNGPVCSIGASSSDEKIKTPSTEADDGQSLSTARSAIGIGGTLAGLIVGATLTGAYFLCIAPRKQKRLVQSAPIQSIVDGRESTSDSPVGRDVETGGDLAHFGVDRSRP